VKYKIEVIAPQQLLCGEGPVWDAVNDQLIWTDSLGESIYCYKNKEHQTHLYHEGLHAASLTLHKSGGLMICGNDGFSLLTCEREVRRFNNIAENIKAIQLNDIIADADGRVFAGQEAFTEDRPYDTGYLFRLNVDNSLHVADGGFHIANGMGFSPDDKKFYVADTILRNIYQYDYNVSNGTISNKKIFFHFDKEDGLPDGLTVDSEGCLWVAMFLGNQIICADAHGVIKDRIELPFAQPTSVTFGGKDLNELFITSSALRWKTNLAPSKHNFNSLRGGGLYRVKTDVQGKLEYRAVM